MSQNPSETTPESEHRIELNLLLRHLMVAMTDHLRDAALQQTHGIHADIPHDCTTIDPGALIRATLDHYRPKQEGDDRGHLYSTFQILKDPIFQTLKELQRSCVKKEFDVLKLWATCALESEYYEQVIKDAKRPPKDGTGREDVRAALQKRERYQKIADTAAAYLKEHCAAYQFFNEPLMDEEDTVPEIETIRLMLCSYGDEVIRLELLREMERQQIERIERMMGSRDRTASPDMEMLQEMKGAAIRVFQRRIRDQEHVLKRMCDGSDQVMAAYQKQLSSVHV